MASISVPLPWQSYVAPRLPELQAGVTRELPGFSARISDGDTQLYVDLDAEGGAAAAFMVAEYLAPMWPALLADHGVSLEVTLDGATWASSAVSMVELAQGKSGRVDWLGGAEFRPGE